jgi:DNA-binding transcriptional ArsR family regulator
MVERSAPRLNATFAALAHPTRRSLLERLAAGEATVTELADPYSISLAAVSKHLQVLEQAGLVKRRVEGRVHHLALRARPMQEATRWLARYRRFWKMSLDALEALAAEAEP